MMRLMSCGDRIAYFRWQQQRFAEYGVMFPEIDAEAQGRLESYKKMILPQSKVNDSEAYRNGHSWPIPFERTLTPHQPLCTTPHLLDVRKLLVDFFRKEKRRF
jgi:hypothetical protein